MDAVDAIIIGSGQGGVPLAADLAAEGKKVVLFERSRLGGSCINWGCTPSKAFLAAAHAAGRTRAAGELGVHASVRVDFPAVMERVRRIRDSYSDSTEARLRRAGVEVVAAEASFAPDGSVQGGGRSARAPKVIIDTGSSAAVPPVPGLEAISYLTDRNFWDLRALPARTVVLGGGYIGLELGQGLARLGSEVHIVDHGERVLRREAPEVSAVLQEALRRDGIRLHLGQEAKRVDQDGDRIDIILSDGSTLEAEALLVAAGRRPNTGALGAAEAGIELDERGRVKVDSRLRSTRPGVYALGEAAGQPAFTHVAWEDYRRLLAVWRGQERSRDDRVLAYAVFTEPQVGRAGLDRDQAKARGIRTKEARMEVRDMMRAVEWGQELGYYQLLADADSGRLLGATLVGYEAAEIVHSLLDLIQTGATARDLDNIVHIHPSYAENLPSLARMLRD